ncbi:MAG: siroheme synthase CysG [Agarilytica sp.]
MDFLPLFFDLKSKHCLVVGGGSIATRKARLLHKALATIFVVSPTIEGELLELVEKSGGAHITGEYDAVHIEDKVLVISATDDQALNQRVAHDCHAKKLPVNVVDNPALCSVIMPAIIDRSPLIIGVTSGGESPVLARRLRTQLESSIPSAYGELGKVASEFRQQVKQTFQSEDERRRFWEAVLNGDIAENVLSGNVAQARSDIQKKIDEKDCDTHGEVYLVGAGPGDPDLLTFKALRLMQKAEIVLYDRLVSPAIVDMVRRDADRIYVGKKRDKHAVPQQEINEMLLAYAQQGKRVLRLKGGDPFIFGRGGEEIDLLAENDIPFQVVPGITAASGCASYAGIPLTHRDHSQSVRFITGHLKTGQAEYPWEEFVNDQQTLVFYMGLKGLPQICEQLVSHGKSADTPAALIEKGTLPEQRVHVSTLAELPETVLNKEIHAPTLLVIGNVVSLHKKLNWYKTSG